MYISLRDRIKLKITLILEIFLSSFLWFLMYYILILKLSTKFKQVQLDS